MSYITCCWSWIYQTWSRLIIYTQSKICGWMAEWQTLTIWCSWTSWQDARLMTSCSIPSFHLFSHSTVRIVWICLQAAAIGQITIGVLHYYVYQARASITAGGMAEGCCQPGASYRRWYENSRVLTSLSYNETCKIDRRKLFVEWQKLK